MILAPKHTIKKKKKGNPKIIQTLLPDKPAKSDCAKIGGKSMTHSPPNRQTDRSRMMVYVHLDFSHSF